jgi:hypothetical protein
MNNDSINLHRIETASLALLVFVPGLVLLLPSYMP